MKFEANAPIWLQVMTDLETGILSGRHPPGSKLPGGRDLAQLYTINPNTAARVYQELERKGLCETRRGLGTFVTEDPERFSALREEQARLAMDQFLGRMALLGFSREAAVNYLEKEVSTCLKAST